MYGIFNNGLSVAKENMGILLTSTSKEEYLYHINVLLGIILTFYQYILECYVY